MAEKVKELINERGKNGRSGITLSWELLIREKATEFPNTAFFSWLH